MKYLIGTLIVYSLAGCSDSPEPKRRPASSLPAVNKEAPATPGNNTNPSPAPTQTPTTPTDTTIEPTSGTTPPTAQNPVIGEQTFQALTVPGLNAANLMQVSAESGGGKVIIYLKAGTSWGLGVADGKLTEMVSDFIPPEGSTIYAIDNKDLWYLTVDTLGRSNNALKTGGEIPGVSVSLPAVVGAADAAGFKVIGINQNRVIASHGGNAYFFTFENNSLAVTKVKLKENLATAATEGKLFAGSCADGGSFWFHDGTSLEILQKRGSGSTAQLGWVTSQMGLKFPSPQTLSGLSMTIEFDINFFPKLAGPVIATSGEGIFIANLQTLPTITPPSTTTTPGTTGAALTFDTDIKPIMEAACVACHATYNTQAAVVAAKATILTRVDKANTAANRMPQPGSPQEAQIDAAKRDKIVAFLNAQTGGGTAVVALTFTNDVLPIANASCVAANCHPQANTEQWWLDRLAATKNRLNAQGNIMPQAGSTQATNFPAANKAKLIQWIDQKLAGN